MSCNHLIEFQKIILTLFLLQRGESNRLDCGKMLGNSYFVFKLYFRRAETVSRTPQLYKWKKIILLNPKFDFYTKCNVAGSIITLIVN